MGSPIKVSRMPRPWVMELASSSRLIPRRASYVRRMMEGSTNHTSRVHGVTG